MRKIYSLVLMTAMLFVGANAWAVTRTASNASEFEAAWTAAQNNDVIQLTNDVTVTSKIFWLGTANMNDAAKSLTLDLNGHVLTQTGDDVKYMFVITHGELNVTTSVPGVGQIIQNGAKNEALFHLTGSSYKNVNAKTAESGYYTHLTIAEGVTVDAKVVNAIVVDEIANSNFWNATYAKASLIVATAGTTAPTAMPYTTRIFYDKPTDQGGKIKRGLANGVRVDLHGIIRGNKYAIKANGNLAGPANPIMSDLTGVWANPEQTIQYAKADGDENFSPFIRIYGTADLRVPASNNAAKKPVAVYCSGYARWLIEGTCIGSTGVYVKSGDVDINDATIQSNYTGNYTPASATNSGVTASGSAIVMESNAAYAGDIDVTISGDTKVEATNGYAIDEAVTNADNTKVDAITITGGTFDGGNVGTQENPQEGTIKITETTVDNTTTTITVNGGTVNGTGEDNVNIGGKDLADYLADATAAGQGATHITYVDNGQGGTTMVISEGSAPSGQETVMGGVASVNWKHNDASTTAMTETIKANIPETDTVVTLTELEINQDYKQTLTIKAGSALNVGRVILGVNAEIIVEAGAKFIVTGAQGIVAPKTSNIILRTSETAQATFLFNPAVSSNRHPNATVEFKTYAHYYANPGIAWQRFGIPAYNNLQSIAYKNPANQGVIRTWIYDYNAVADDWNELGEVGVNLNATSMNRPFAGYMMECNATTEGTEFVMTGELVGNTDANLYANMTYTTFANSFTAPIKMRYFYDKLGNGVAKGLYLAKRNGHAYTFETFNDLLGDLDGTMILPMQSFILYNPSMQTALNNIGYEEMVYNPAMGLPHVGAPARHVDNDMTKIIISIEDEYGSKDRLGLAKSDLFTDGFDNGYDMPKLMNDELNIFISEDDYMSTMASNEIENTYLGFSCKEAGNYTINIVCAEGEEFVLQDLSNNALILMTNNASYQFYANENEHNDYRFKIVSRQEMPTAVETIEKETISNDGIYTITGQYVGEMSIWNSLPEGMYIVNGVKKIK